ncbi:hypothetical protein SEVIR_6G086400v4 [Setaria viridis]|uniref:Uncharacterized protein n=1 Tax=Setaria viridis TaxID=4556 RepID=A0A4U6U576_SETVI|nr:hypothetical protein SEVIR_6G086400v2 [Setaria viridis]TKW09315.1 hypothetical protein SEVIR_6G086400v2 [Setaria viridis]
MDPIRGFYENNRIAINSRDPNQGVMCKCSPPPWLFPPGEGDGEGRLLVAHRLIVALGRTHPLQPPPHQTPPPAPPLHRPRLSSIGSGRSPAPIPQSAPQPSPAPPLTRLLFFRSRPKTSSTGSSASARSSNSSKVRRACAR